MNRFQRRGHETLASKKRGAKPKPLRTGDQQTRLLSVLRRRVPNELGLGEALWIRSG